MTTITTPRMLQIARDLNEEGWYTWSNAVAAITDDRDALLLALRQVQMKIDGDNQAPVADTLLENIDRAMSRGRL